MSKIGEYMNKMIPNSQLHFMDSDLFPNLFHPKEFNTILETFILSDHKIKKL
jgi:hypothetical protein